MSAEFGKNIFMLQFRRSCYNFKRTMWKHQNFSCSVNKQKAHKILLWTLDGICFFVLEYLDQGVEKVNFCDTLYSIFIFLLKKSNVLADNFLNQKRIF